MKLSNSIMFFILLCTFIGGSFALADSDGQASGGQAGKRRRHFVISPFGSNIIDMGVISRDSSLYSDVTTNYCASAPSSEGALGCTLHSTSSLFTNATCTGTGPAGHCIDVMVDFNDALASPAIGLYSATISFPKCVMNWSDQNPVCEPDGSGSVAVYVKVVPGPPPMCPSNTPSNSTIGVDGQTVSEDLPLVGSNFGMQYSSAFAPQYQSLTAELQAVAYNYGFNNEGLTFTVHHLYDPNADMLFTGSGSVTKAGYSTNTDGTLSVVDPSGNFVYVFSATGQHLKTLTALTGSTAYTFGYDPAGYLTTITDGAANISTITRNSSEQATSFKAPRGQITTFGLNASGLIATVTNPNSEIYTLTYPSGSGLLSTFKKPGGQVATFTYNANGFLIKDLGFGGDFWSLTQSGSNLIQASEMNRQTTFGAGYDSSGNYTRSETDPSGLITSHYESNGTSVNDSGPIVATTSTITTDPRFGSLLQVPNVQTYKAASLTSTTNYTRTLTQGSGTGWFNYQTLQTKATTSGRVTTSTFTNSTKTKVDSTPMGVLTTTVYDSLERPTSIKLGADTATSLTYDTYGRLYTSAQGTQNKNTFAYDSLGNLHTVTNGRSEVTTYGYDLSGRKTSTTLPDTRVINYSYDANGNLTGVTPPSRPLHSLFYNAMELTSEYTAPTVTGVNSNTTYTYNLDRQLTQINLPSGGTVVYTYDPTTGLLSNYVTDAGTYTYSYSASSPGLVHSIHSPYNMQNDFSYHGYDVASNVQTRISDGFVFGTVTYGYDTDHRITSRSLQGTSGQSTSTQNFTLNNDGNPSVAGAESLTYDTTSGRLSTTTLGIVSDSYSYDIYGNVSGYTAKYTPAGGAATTLYSYTLTRDNMSRVTGKSETISGVTSTYVYTYDTAARLKTATKNGANIASFVYDGNSNRTSISLNGNAAFTAVYDNQDRLTTYGSTTFSYDGNGSIITSSHSNGTSASFVYDNLGNFKKLTGITGNVFTYGYDGRNQLNWISKNGTTLFQRLVYDGHGNVVAEENGSGVITKEYVYGVDRVPDYVIIGGVNYKMIKDYQGSVKMVVNALTGGVAEAIGYDVPGNVISDTSSGFQTFGFAGGIYDTLSLYVHFGARWYDPSTGRWTSKDPIRFDGGDTNLYGYVLNDPVNYEDPTGFTAIPIPVPIVGPTVGATTVGAIVAGLCALQSDSRPRKLTKQECVDQAKQRDEIICDHMSWVKERLKCYAETKRTLANCKANADE